MKKTINSILLLGLLFSATLAHAEKGKWTSDLSLQNQPQILLETSDDCEEGDAYCYNGEHYVCRNGDWVLEENCKANNKMCHPNPYEARCIECELAENTSPAVAFGVEYHQKYNGILCTGSSEGWYKIEIPAGKTLNIQVFWEGGEGGGVYMDMFDNTAAQFVETVNEAMEIVYCNTGQAATFYLKVYNVDDWQRFSGYAFYAQLND